MAGRDDLVLKISADTTAVASGLQPMTNALDQMEKQAGQAEGQLQKLSGVNISPTVDDTGMKSAAASLDAMNTEAGKVKGTLTQLDQAKVSPPVDTSTVDKLTAAAKESGEKLKNLGDPVTLSVRDQAITRARERIRELKDQIAEDVEMGVDTKPALRELSTLERSLGELTEEPAVVSVEVDEEDTDFAFEAMAKLKRGVKSLTDALLSIGDGLKALPDLVSAGVGSFTTLNASMKSFLERQEAAGLQASRFTTRLGAVTGFLAGPWGIAVGGAMVLLSNMISKIGDADKATMEFAKSLDYQTGALDRNNRVKAFNELKNRDLLGTVNQLNLSANEFVKAIAGDPVAVARLVSQLNALDAANQKIIDSNQMAASKMDQAGVEAAENAKLRMQQTDLLRRNLMELVGAEADVVSGTAAMNEAVDGVAPTASITAQAIEKLGGAVSTTGGQLTYHEALWADYSKRIGEAQTELDKLVDSLDLFNGRTATAREATAQYQEDLDNLTAAIKENGRTTKDHGKTLDLDSAKGRANQAMLIKTAQDIEALRKARMKDMDTSGESAKKITDDYEKQRAALYKTAHQMGLSETAAKTYVDQLLKIPDKAETKAVITGADKAEATMKSLTKDREATVHVKLQMEKFTSLPKRIQDAISGNGSVNLSAAPTAAPMTISPLVTVSPRIFLDSRPIRFAIKPDVEAAVSSTVAATKKRGRLW